MTFASYFRDAAQDMAAAINETMGETVTVTPYTVKANFPAAPDATLPAFKITMVFMHRSATAFTDRSSYRSSGSKDIEIAAAIQTRKPIFSVKACDLPFTIGRQFRIHRCFDGTDWEVTASKPDGISRVELDVVQLGRASQLERPLQ